MPMLHGVDCEPSYFIVGGLVFMPLTQPFLEMVFGGSGKRRWERGMAGASSWLVAVHVHVGTNSLRGGTECCLSVKLC